MSQVCYRLDQDTARITLNRPERHNSLVPELLSELRAAIDRCRRDQPAVLVLDAAGRSFSTGGDVAGFYDTPPEHRQHYAANVVGELNRAILDLLALPLPTIVVVEGMVTGGSLGLVLGCDIAVAGPRASFAPWYTVVGFSPDGGWSALLPERIGRGRALDIQLCNRTVKAPEAFDIGLVQYLSAGEEALTQALSLADQIRSRQRASVARTLTLTRPDPARIAGALEQEYRQFLEQIGSIEADQGMAAFLGRQT